MAEPAATAPPEVWTVRALLNWTTQFLHKKGFESARLESQLLLAHVLGCTRIEVFARSDVEPTAAEKTAFRELIRKRSEGWPVAYLVGSREFYLLKFEVTPAVLVPRPDTETLVLEALKLLHGRQTPSVLDLGTGSGCVAISIAHQFPRAQVTAVDLSPDAIEVARRNANKHGVSDRMSLLCGDLFDPLPTDATFDIIVSNPPYITHAEFAELPADVRDHEPRLALDGGPDGLAFYRRIANEAGRRLNPGGSVLVEIGSTQEPAVRGLFETQPELTALMSVKDMAGRWRVVMAKKR